MRLGIEPKGIIGCGYVSSQPYSLPHWDEQKSQYRTWTPQAGGLSNQ